ncbi:GNAT family N-acetyltransferase [Stenotrophomonas humi]
MTSASKQPHPIDHNPAQARFETTVDGHLAVLEYVIENGAMVITHTGVPEAIGGRGIAADLTRTALAHARAVGLKVVPACTYAATFMQRHSEYTDLLG